LQFYGNDASAPGPGIKASISAVTNSALGDDADLIFKNSDGATNNIERMRISYAGNVGIGTSSPDANLTVNGAASFAAGTALLPSIARAGDLNTGIFFPAADTIAFSEGGVEAMRLDASGNLLVGTTTNTNSSRLVVNGTISETVGGVQYQVVSQADIGTEPNEIPLNQYLGNLAYQDAANIAGPVGVGGALTVVGATTLTSTVGIGTASPSASAILDAQSTTQGVRMPNMTTTQKNAIASPAAGLMVYDTTLAKLCVYTTAWETITSL
jgi:hypothetical protein